MNTTQDSNIKYMVLVYEPHCNYDKYIFNSRQEAIEHIKKNKYTHDIVELYEAIELFLEHI